MTQKGENSLPSLDRTDSVEAVLAVMVVHHELEALGHAVALTRTFVLKRHLQSRTQCHERVRFRCEGSAAPSSRWA